MTEKRSQSLASAGSSVLVKHADAYKDEEMNLARHFRIISDANASIRDDSVIGDVQNAAAAVSFKTANSLVLTHSVSYVKKRF